MGISLSKMEKDAPDLVSMYKSAAVSLRKNGLSGTRAAVYLVLDHSGSMSHHYANGNVQYLTEQVLSLSANLDDDGTVPLVFFSNNANRPVDVQIGQHTGVVDHIRRADRLSWGGTMYSTGIAEVIKHYTASGAKDPALVLFQTDGQTYDQYETNEALRQASRLPIFWQFIGFGEETSAEFGYLRQLDTLSGRVVDNAGFFATGVNPRSISDERLYDQMLKEYPAWLQAARAAGIIA